MSEDISLVDWTAGRLLPAPRAKNPSRRETYYPVRCANPGCGLVRYLTKSAATKAQDERRVCKRCQTSEAGKLGYAATAAAYGHDFALRACRAHQITSPSSYEIIMNDWVFELTTAYEFQMEFSAVDPSDVTHNFILDFEVTLAHKRGKLAIEVCGYHHKKFRADRDYWLNELYPGQVLFIDTDDMDADPEGVKAKLRDIIDFAG